MMQTAIAVGAVLAAAGWLAWRVLPRRRDKTGCRCDKGGSCCG
jgi:hypothetical protein